MIELVFPLPPPELHPNARVHWRVKSRVRDGTKTKLGYRDATVVLARQQTKGKLRPPVLSRVTFAYKVDRKRDDDNLLAWCKTLFDSLVIAKILERDDGTALHHAPVQVVIDKTLKAPEVRVRLEEME